jgi:hypothetical protein
MRTVLTSQTVIAARDEINQSGAGLVPEGSGCELGAGRRRILLHFQGAPGKRISLRAESAI